MQYVLYGGVLVKEEIITFGIIVAFIVYARLFTSPLQQIAQGLTNLQSAAAASERVFEFLEEDEMLDESEKTKFLDKLNVKGNIEFEHVKFGYDDSDKLVIKDFSCKAKPRRKNCNCSDLLGARKNNFSKSFNEIL